MLPTGAEGTGREEVSPGRGPGEVCLLWDLGCFSQEGSLLLRRENHFSSPPPLCWEHYTCVGGNNNVELYEN